MPRLTRRVFAILLLLGGWTLVGSDRAPAPVVPFNEAIAAPSRWEPSRDGQARSHDLSSTRVFSRVILFIKDNYVDPQRVKPKEMIVSALEYVEKAVPDVMVEGTPESGKLSLNVNGKSKELDISHIDSMWKMHFAVRDAFEFIAKNMRPMEDTRDVEYAAVNGMLSTLDPHSVLLRPEVYREMKLTTKGEFGGLGFVIQMKEGNLTVVKVLPKTPAYRAGIKKDDVIARIGEESTVNMDLNEAVSKLRGPVDSKVSITVNRKAWDRSQSMTLTRAMISIESVQSKMLSENVGYIRVKNFQGNTTRDLQASIEQLEAQAGGAGGMKGIVLDLRGNPGGLLEQAIQVSDVFVSDGTIVSTVGYSDKVREEKRAREDDFDNRYPIAVLVNAGSASASEIVAGALKQLDRAVIIGRQTFGKGSVQVLYDFPDDSALKLTIAKYLTPGDKSIQEVGIVPDIALVPTRVTKDRVDVFAPRKSVGEADLDRHFGNPESQSVAKKREEVLGREKPLHELRYLKEDAKQKDASAKQQLEEEGKNPKLAGKEKKPADPHPLLDVDIGGSDEDLDDQMDAESQDEIKEDFEVLFARDYVLRAPFTNRKEMLKASKLVMDEKRREEEQRINAAIGALGLDWSPGPTPKNVQLSSTLKPGADAKITAGEVLEMEVTVENRGQEPVKRLRGWTESENPFLDHRELLFGALKPGEKRSWKVPIKLPKDLASRRDDVTVRFHDDSGPLSEKLVSELNFAELPRPQFAFSWQVLDACKECNGDGLIQRGEEIELLLDVQNTGTGKALDSYAQIKNAADQNIFIEKGRFKIGALEPGETRAARFVLSVKKGYRDPTFPLKLAIIDEPLEEFSSEKLQLPVTDTPVTVEPRKGALKITEKAAVYPAPTAEAKPLARLTKGATLALEGKAGEFYKVVLENGRSAFVKAQDGREVKGKALPVKEVEYLAHRDPPHIELSTDASQGGIVANGERFTLSGTVTNPKNLLDVYVLVNDQKVFFKSGPGSAAGEPAQLRFSTELTLKEGNNNVLVVARESQDFASRRAVVIRRRPAAVAAQLEAATKGKAPTTVSP